MKNVLLLLLTLPGLAVAAEFSSEETACGFGELNAAYATAYAESYANAKCDGLAKRVSDWKLTDFVEAGTGVACTKAQANFSCR